MKAAQTYFITGVSGFVGRALAEKLIDQGQHVIGIDLVSPQILNEKFTYLPASVVDEVQYEAFLAKSDHVIHAAAVVPITHKDREFYYINTTGTEKIVALAVKNKIKSFTLISSSAVFGNVQKNDCPIKNESTKHLMPIEKYGKSKKEAEDIVFRYFNNGATKILVIRPRTILGPGRLGLFDTFYELINKGKKVPIIGNGRNVFQFADINDVVSVCLAAVNKGIDGVFNVGARDSVALEDEINSLIRHANSKSKILKISPRIAQFIFSTLKFLGLSPLNEWHYKTMHLDFHYDLAHLGILIDVELLSTNQSTLRAGHIWHAKRSSQEFARFNTNNTPASSIILRIAKRFL